MSKHKHNGWLMYDLYSWSEWYVTVQLGNFRVDFIRFNKEDK